MESPIGHICFSKSPCFGFCARVDSKVAPYILCKYRMMTAHSIYTLIEELRIDVKRFFSDVYGSVLRQLPLVLHFENSSGFFISLLLFMSIIAAMCLSALTADTACKLDILRHDSNTLCVDCAQVGVLE